MKPKIWRLAIPSIVSAILPGIGRAAERMGFDNSAQGDADSIEEVREVADYLAAKGMVRMNPDGKIEIHKSLLKQLKQMGVVKSEMASEGTSTIGGGCRTN